MLSLGVSRQPVTVTVAFIRGWIEQM